MAMAELIQDKRMSMMIEMTESILGTKESTRLKDIDTLEPTFLSKGMSATIVLMIDTIDMLELKAQGVVTSEVMKESCTLLNIKTDTTGMMRIPDILEATTGHTLTERCTSQSITTEERDTIKELTLKIIQTTTASPPLISMPQFSKVLRGHGTKETLLPEDT